MFKLIKKIKSVSGQSLAEFAVVTAMMGTMATVAAPKFSGVGEGAKEKKSMSTIDNIVKAANNFYNTAVADEGRGRFPGQEKFDREVGGYGTDNATITEIEAARTAVETALTSGGFEGYADTEGANWRSVFGIAHTDAPISSVNQADVSVTDDAGAIVGSDEFLAGFGDQAILSPFQDGHYIYVVVPGGGSGNSAEAPTLYVADLENPALLNKELRP